MAELAAAGTTATVGVDAAVEIVGDPGWAGEITGVSAFVELGVLIYTGVVTVTGAEAEGNVGVVITTG